MTPPPTPRCAPTADLKPEVAREFKRVLNQIGLERFERAVEEESAVQRDLQRRAGEDGV